MNRQERKTFPVNLLLEGRPVLVVGGGRVARRKIERLLMAGADVRVVAPAVVAEVRRLARDSRLTLIERPYHEHDLDSKPCLVYAATDSVEVNQAVLKACKERGILCCSADANWSQGDFLTPASLEKSGLTVAVSTQGRSCVRSRLVKEAIARHVDLVGEADLMLIGTDHRRLALQQREPYHLSGDKLKSVAMMLNHIWGIHEFVILNTCNRIEVYAIMSPRKPVIDNVCRLLGFDHLDQKDYYVYHGRNAFDHLAQVLAGLLSQVPCEESIVAQVKQAWNKSATAEWSGGMLDKVFNSALFVSRRIRAAVRPLVPKAEIEDIAVSYSEKIGGALKEKKCIVIGTGAVGTALVQKLQAKSAATVWCWRHHRPDGHLVPETVRLIQWADFAPEFKKTDIVFCATQSQNPVLTPDICETASLDRNIITFDLGIPRNVTADLVAPRLRIVDLDELKKWHLNTTLNLEKIGKSAREVIVQNAERYPDFKVRHTGQ